MVSAKRNKQSGTEGLESGSLNHVGGYRVVPGCLGQRNTGEASKRCTLSMCSLDGKGSHRGLVLGKSYLTNQQGLRCHNTRDTENELICESGMPRHCPVLTVQATD